MKTFKKVLASALAAAMVVTAFPVTNAEAATKAKLSATKATIYVGQSKTIKVTLPKGAKITSVKTKKAVATVKKSGKKVVVKAVKAGKATVTVKVTPKKGKAKSLKATITVKNPTLTVKAAATELAVGETTTITAKATPKKTVSFKSTDETIATVDAKTGVVTAVKAGTVKITATAGSLTKNVDLTIKNAIFKGIAQKSVTTLEATFAGNTKDLKAGDFKITNTFNNVTYAVKDVTVDAKDATKVTLTTYMDMKDAKDYTVEYDGTTQKFTATDGVVVAVGIDKTQIDAATETEVKAVALAANDVVVDSKAYGDSKLSMAFNVTNGYLNGSKLYLNKAGDKATVDVTYHKGSYDSTGKEEVIEAKGLVVTAVEPEKVTVNGWAVKIGAPSKTFATVTETKIAVGDTKTAYVQITDSKNKKSVDISSYTVESSNKDALIVNSVVATNGAISLTAVKEGTSYILVKDNKGTVVTTLPISVVAARKATSIAVDKTDVTLSSVISETADIKVTVKDQYSEELSATGVKLETLTFAAPNAATTTSAAFNDAAVSLTNGKFTVASASKAVGKYVVKLTANDLSTTFAINVVSTSATTKTSYAFDMATTTADAVITKTAASNTSLSAKVYQLNEGVKTKVLTSSNVSVSLKNAKNEIAMVGTTTAAAIDASGNITIKVNDKNSGNKLAAGSYTLTVSGTGVPTFTRTIVITDSQTTVSAKRIAEHAATVGACFEFYLEGEKITPSTVQYFNGNTDVTSAPTGTVTPITKAVVTYTYGANTVIQTVSIGLTVTVD